MLIYFNTKIKNIFFGNKKQGFCLIFLWTRRGWDAVGTVLLKTVLTNH